MKKIISVLAAIILSLLVAASAVGCASEEKATPTPAPASITPIELVPEGADLVAEVKLSQILGDTDLTGIYDIFPKDSDAPQTVAAALDMLEAESGIDLRDFSQVIVFGNVTQDMGGGAYFAAIVTGTLEEDSLVAAIERSGDVELTPIDYKGYKIYTDESQEGVITFLNGEALVIGTMQPVKDVIDVREGDKSALSGKVLETYNELGDALIKVAWEPVPGQVGQLIGQALEALSPQLSVDLTKLTAFEAVGFGIAKNDTSLGVHLKLAYPTSEAAEDAETALKGLLMLLPIMPAGIMPEEVRGLLDKIEISASESWLTISLEMTLAEIGELIESRSKM